MVNAAKPLSVSRRYLGRIASVRFSRFRVVKKQGGGWKENKGGERTFALPQKAEVVYELYDGREVARDTDRFQVTLPSRSTALYYTGDRELISKLAARE